MCDIFKFHLTYSDPSADFVLKKVKCRLIKNKVDYIKNVKISTHREGQKDIIDIIIYYINLYSSTDFIEIHLLCDDDDDKFCLFRNKEDKDKNIRVYLEEFFERLDNDDIRDIREELKKYMEKNELDVYRPEYNI